jgi:hypothetical protein
LKYCPVSKHTFNKSELIRYSIRGTHQSTDNFIVIENKEARLIRNNQSDSSKYFEIEDFLRRNKFSYLKRERTLKQVQKLIDCNNNPVNFGVF